MDNQKGMKITDFFIYIGIAFIGLFTFSRIGSVFTDFNVLGLLLILIDICIVGGYFGLLKNKRSGLMLVGGGCLAYVIVQSLYIEGGIVLSILSPEILITLFVICGMLSKLKTLE